MNRIAKRGGWMAALAAALLLLTGGPAAAEYVQGLYQAQTIVTGTRAETRLPGLAVCLEDVLVKLSGDPRLIGDQRVAQLGRDAASFVAAYSYRDRMAHLPINDEQGTRDRPHFLMVTFDERKIDEALRALGRAPWTAPRPRLVTLIAIRGRTETYMVSADEDSRDRERDALVEAAARRGMPIALPDRAALDRAGVSAEKPPAADLDATAKALGGDRALVGHMDWDARAPGWTAHWTLGAPGQTHRWQDRAATYDDAFRQALGTAALILSGKGSPN